jgi:hypothetical protein
MRSYKQAAVEAFIRVIDEVKMRSFATVRGRSLTLKAASLKWQSI